ncbi:ribose-5-phosphate isomerase [Allobranchiibius sp. GilTou73]|uniref:ribose-5-phosphate isomerase n=1 Tax=Allobranchiibius sp. GilTou73 TaxID=2904523 RepID=UPI001F177219|nr:ribose-5-phosphate isomerase [Allobranchiibius sp. GilTou73]UIJ33390.1 ribose-5-phosphate isomerase [Allobranchiibius sp. GilTou73]
MRVHIGGDHAAYDMHRELVRWLGEQGHEVVDHGAKEYDAQDDYPVFVLRAAEGVAQDEGSLGIVLGGSGNGEQMAANKVPGIRAALCYTTELAQIARQHNNAQVISLGGRFNTVEQAKAMVSVFLETPFSGEERHQRRLDMLTRFEKHGSLPQE